MKTLNLSIIAMAIMAAASTSAFAASMDSNGNIPNHNSDKINAYTNSVDPSANPYIEQTVRPAAKLSASDSDVLQMHTYQDKTPN